MNVADDRRQFRAGIFSCAGNRVRVSGLSRVNRPRLLRQYGGGLDGSWCPIEREAVVIASFGRLADGKISFDRKSDRASSPTNRETSSTEWPQTVSDCHLIRRWR